MDQQALKTKVSHSKSVNGLPRRRRSSSTAFSFIDARPEAIAQRKLQGIINNSPRTWKLNTIQEMANNRPQKNDFPLQVPHLGVLQKQAQQQYASKFVAESARNHYKDGWGEQYGIENDDELKENVPDEVTGSGYEDLGWYDAPDSEQDPNDRTFQKQCTILYRDGKYKDETLIYHCGPSGRKHWY